MTTETIFCTVQNITHLLLLECSADVSKLQLGFDPIVRAYAKQELLSGWRIGERRKLVGRTGEIWATLKT